MRRRRPRVTFALERLEPRVVLNAPPSVPGAPVFQPQDGAWRQTPFVGSPIFSDLDGDGAEELITAAAGGRLIAYSVSESGAIETFQTYETGAEANFKATPIVVERPGGSKMIVAALGRDEAASPTPLEDGRVFAFDALSGQVLSGWPVSTGENVNGESGVFGPVSSGDVNGDGVPEILVTSFSHFLTVYRLDGSVLWRYNADDTIVSGAVVGDMDRDGSPEVVFGSDSSASQFFHAGGFLNILNHQGSAKYRIPVGEVIWSSPVLADLNGDGFLEAVVGTGFNFSIQTPSDQVRAAGNQLLAFDHLGNPLPGWPYRTTTDNSLDRQVYGSPAVADLNDDGDLEVVAVDRAGLVHVVMFNGSPLPGFEGGVSVASNGGDVGDVFASPIIADVDGDGRQDIVASAREALTALDAEGNRLFLIVSPDVDSRFNAAAVGQFDGEGGLELAAVSNISQNPNRPHTVAVRMLPESSVAPAWPLHRKTASGIAVAQNPTFINRYIRATFRALLDREASASDMAFFSEVLLTNRFTPRWLADTVALTPESRGVVVKRLYQRYLDRQPSAQELAAGRELLADRPASELTKELLLSPEFAGLTDGSTAGVMSRIWRTVIRRDMNAAERAAFVPLVENGVASLEQIADMLLLSEEFILLDVVVPVVIAYRSEFPNAPFDEAAVATVLFDRAGARREEEIRAAIVYSGGRFERTSVAGRFVRSVFQDLLERPASPGEVASWLRLFAEGALSTSDFVRFVLESPEGRRAHINRESQRLLGRAADPGMIAFLINFSRREEVAVNLVASQEYFNRNGGTVGGFVAAAFRDVARVDAVPAEALNEWVARIQSGTPRSELPRQLLENRSGREPRIVRMLFRYAPDESQGVLRTGNGPLNGPAVNPDPDLIQAFLNARAAGATETDLLSHLLTRGEYLSKVAYDRGAFRSRGIRN